MVLSISKKETDIADIYHLVVLNAHIIAGINPYRIAVARHCTVIAVKYVVRTSIRFICPVRDKGLDDCIRIHRRLRILGNIIFCRLDKRYDMLDSGLCVLIMIKIPERMGLRPVKRSLSFCVILKDRCRIIADHCLNSIQICNRCICRIIPAVQPVNNLVFYIRISCLRLVSIGSILQDFKFCNQCICIFCCYCICIKLFLKLCQFRCQLHGFLKCSYSAVHVLVDHMLGKFS